ncbi:MAG: SIS domain-containing protein, partial [Candidatus Thermoplasmatota archaeon]
MLDDLIMISNIDKSNMLDTIAELPKQIKDALHIIESSNIPDFIKIDSVVVTGMGASGISGDIFHDLFYDKLETPFFVNKGYTLPKWVDKNTLTVFLSYSGNTEETITSLKNALQKKSRIICVSSGGKLKEISEKSGLFHIGIPSGFQPRAAIAYLLFPLIYILKRNHVISNTVDNDIEETLTILGQYCNQFRKDIPESENLPKQIAHRIHNTTPQLYGWGIYTSIARRWRTQINENSKM